MKSRGVLTENELRDDMENWLLYENSFSYAGKRYYMEHQGSTGQYLLDDGKEDRFFDDFDAVLSAKLHDGRTLKKALPYIDWDN